VFQRKGLHVDPSWSPRGFLVLNGGEPGRGSTGTETDSNYRTRQKSFRRRSVPPTTEGTFDREADGQILPSGARGCSTTVTRGESSVSGLSTVSICKGGGTCGEGKTHDLPGTTASKKEGRAAGVEKKRVDWVRYSSRSRQKKKRKHGHWEGEDGRTGKRCLVLIISGGKKGSDR